MLLTIQSFNPPYRTQWHSETIPGWPSSMGLTLKGGSRAQSRIWQETGPLRGETYEVFAEVKLSCISGASSISYFLSGRQRG